MNNPLCPDCGNEMSNAGADRDGHYWHCQDCEDAETMRRDWEYDQYRRMDAEDYPNDFDPGGDYDTFEEMDEYFDEDTDS